MGYSKHKTGVNKYDPVLTYCWFHIKLVK
jgi:hypothetical protein